MTSPSSPQCRCQAGELLCFVQLGNLRRVERALARGADVDGVGSHFAHPPLVLAAEEGLVKMVKLLLRRGANIDVAARFGANRGSDDGFEERPVVAGTTALHGAVYHRRLPVVRLLLRSGGNPNAVDSEGFAPLHLVCDTTTADAVVIASTLLKGGADPLLGDADGEIAIHFAARLGHVEMVDLLLLKAPASLNRPSSDGITPLCLAVTHGRKAMVLHLLRLGAKQPVELDPESTSPLVTAVRERHDEVLRILLEHGMGAVGSKVSITAALGFAVRNGRAKSLDSLLGHFDRDDGTLQRFPRWVEGNLPLLHVAVLNARLTIVSVLLGAGADEMVVDNDGDYASEMVDLVEDIDPETKATLLRILKRGPAFRASSWRWPASICCLPSAGRVELGIMSLAGERRVGPLRVGFFGPRSKKSLAGIMCWFAR